MFVPSFVCTFSCGLLGPSGAGKSTFFSTIGGTQTLPKQGLVYRYHVVNATAATSSNTIVLERILPKQVAWLQQHASFFEMLTVYETLSLAAQLELPHMSAQQRDGLIDQKMDALGLQPVAARRIGSYVSPVPGGAAGSSSDNRLSGGERRRLSVALELLTEKQIFLADEPTTGLDSAMAVRVMKLIKYTAVDLHIPAIVVLHQPRSSVWHSLDSVILMAAGGRVVYHGARSNAVRHFTRLGYTCPEMTNPAEYLIDLVAIDPEDPFKAVEDEVRVQYLAKAFEQYQKESWARTLTRTLARHVRIMDDNEKYEEVRRRPVVRFGTRIPRFGSLLRRSWRQNIRNIVTNTARFVMSVGMAAPDDRIVSDCSRTRCDRQQLGRSSCAFDTGGLCCMLHGIHESCQSV
jgi:ABC-type multidrug transport system ATPase subunit